ncbi:hypothetical protein Ahy_B10g106178 isoform B [Arachis hypogaea]|uniref:UDP-N-acetylglucosamine transferase subunit ALG14 n=1 Tax=Arachis hypogaea TaxID=3818 RepID=A0A444X9Z1_ARAHY|nr:hypothetical protein Ahy_B10g106178 isoform B [Arachis hypogaea]
MVFTIESFMDFLLSFLPAVVINHVLFMFGLVVTSAFSICMMKQMQEDVNVPLTEISNLPLMDKGNGCSFSAVTSTAIISSVIFVITLILVRVLFVIYCSSRPMSRRAQKPVSTLIILGSGGHTAEMLDLLAVLQKDRFYPRFYIAAATDNMSLQKAELLENSLAAEKGTPITNAGKFMKIYRSREVGQSYITSIWTTLVAMILCNGPGTCIPICAIAFVFKVLGIRWSSIFYVESIARVRRLSLSGLLLYKLRIADQLFVQWPRLQQQYPRAIYVGRLM